MYVNFIKPVFDFIISAVALVVLSPVFLLVSILIKLDSKGPVFFKQERLGRKEKLFMLYKFRSMTNRDHSADNRQVFEGDPEVTRVGHFIRRTKIDELPQLWNVFIGDMSIIGPRPCLPKIKPLFGDKADARFGVKPGLSSLAAIKGSIYLTWEQKGYWDAYYVENISFYLDILIVISTLKVLVVGEKKMFNNK